MESPTKKEREKRKMEMKAGKKVEGKMIMERKVDEEREKIIIKKIGADKAKRREKMEKKKI